MTSIKVKFRSSAIDGGQGTIFYQIIHNRIVRQIKTQYKIYENEWCSNFLEIAAPLHNDERRIRLSEIKENISSDIRRLKRIVTSLEQEETNFCSDDIVRAYQALYPINSLFKFMEETIRTMKTLGKLRTSETYSTTLNSFRKFRNHKDIPIDKIDSELLSAYEAYLKRNGIKPNSSSFYMRNLRAVYNRAVEKGITPQNFPFRHVYTGVDKTIKRAVSLKVIKQIKKLDLSHNCHADFARDMFLFSFYTRGMSLIDMSYLQKKDLTNGILSYRRRKTGQLLFIRWEKPMQEIVDKYHSKDSIYLLPIIN